MVKKILKAIFSVGNENCNKVIRVLGIKIKFKNHNAIIQKALQDLDIKYDNLTERNKQIKAQNAKIYDRLIDIRNLNSELLYSQVFHDSIIGSVWLKEKNFTLIRGAANYSFAYLLFTILNNIEVSSILEFGLGQTSKITSQYVINKNQNALLSIVDHDEEWIKTFKQQISKNENVRIFHKNLEKFIYNNTENDKYENLSDIIDSEKFDLILVDGPNGFDREYPRTNVVDLIPQNLAQDFIIVCDDLQRKGEQNTAELIFEKLEKSSIDYEKSYRYGTKTQLIITSKSYSFVHWF